MNQTLLNLMAGSIGAFISFAFGGWNGMLEFFLFAIILDYVTGVLCAIKEKNLSSEVGFWGLIKKVLMIVAVMLGHRADLALGLDYVMMGLVWAFLANEVVSLAENYGRLGLPLSQYIQPIIAVLKQKGSGNDANTKQ